MNAGQPLTVTERSAYEAIRLAQLALSMADDTGRKIEMRSSADLCLSDALAMFNEGRWQYAKQRALDSLKYSEGVFSTRYAQAKLA